ncbi:biopolymer transporter ExbD [candidate division KSB1 bacterium]|nr:biopolymer transporter ExbD [candidate division KSB1 bacterium]MBL7092995.1 biopolymer transporter ExbD [candidate division KSB1 bacterium]
MNLKKSIGRERRIKDVDVNIIPVMNIFLLLIPFLLLTAAFVRLAIVEISLPTLGKNRAKQVQETPKNLVAILLSVKETGFQLKSPGFIFKPVNKINNQYNYDIIVEQLKQIKNKHPHAEDIFIAPEAKVKYDIIIKVMDRCREIGFPNVSLSG